MNIGSKELRKKIGYVLDRVRHGESVTVTVRGRPVAVMTPVQRPTADDKAFLPIAFGIWSDRGDMTDVEARLDALRGERFPR